MLRWFERRIEPYPHDDPQQPPPRLIAYMRHYLVGTKRWFALMVVCTALMAISEISLFGVLGNVVDWLSKADRATFLQTEGPRLWLGAIVVIVLLPLIAWFESLTI